MREATKSITKGSISIEPLISSSVVTSLLWRLEMLATLARSYSREPSWLLVAMIPWPSVLMAVYTLLLEDKWNNVVAVKGAAYTTFISNTVCSNWDKPWENIILIWSSETRSMPFKDQNRRLKAIWVQR